MATKVNWYLLQLSIFLPLPYMTTVEYNKKPFCAVLCSTTVLNCMYSCTHAWAVITGTLGPVVLGFGCVFACFFLTRGNSFAFALVFACFYAFHLGCQCRAINCLQRLITKNDLLCVEWDIKLCSFTNTVVNWIIPTLTIISWAVRLSQLQTAYPRPLWVNFWDLLQ